MQKAAAQARGFFAFAGDAFQKSEAMPLFSQSP
jgi:hypothetical protein